MIPVYNNTVFEKSHYFYFKFYKFLKFSLTFATFDIKLVL